MNKRQEVQKKLNYFYSSYGWNKQEALRKIKYSNTGFLLRWSDGIHFTSEGK